MMNRILWMLALVTLFGGAGRTAEETVLAPAAWRTQPAKNSTTVPADQLWKTGLHPAKDVHSYWCEQSADVPAQWLGKRVYLDFSRIEGDAILFVNGQRVGELLRPGGEIEITAQAQPGGENRIRVFLTRDYTDISRGFEQDRLRYVCRNHMTGKLPMERWGIGISGEVRLFARANPAGLAEVIVEPSWRKKELGLQVRLDAKEAVAGLRLSAEVFDENGQKALTVPARTVEVPAGRSVVRLAAAWAAPQLWELERGYLYTLRVTLERGNAVVEQSAPIRFGFREIWTEGRQILMNGHPAHWRLTLLHSPLTFGDNSPNGMAFARLLGYNAGYIQAHPELWWRASNWTKETPLFSQKLLEASDRAGFAILLPAPSVAFLGTAVYEDAAARRDYEREMELHLRHYRNHPSVLAWIVGMNSVSFANEAITPQKMGQRFEQTRLASGQACAIATACSIANAKDPTRLAYSHADGNIGDMASTNFYLNFAPLQEREEWPKAWAASGNMPYQMAEFGPPYTANYWKGKRFLPTEYFAIYFGNRAYAEETDRGLAQLVGIGLQNTTTHGNGALTDDNYSAYPLYRDFQQLFYRNTNRAFRTWGINGGWAYWRMRIPYGQPAGSTFDTLPPFKEIPVWANDNVRVERQANLPLLVYLAGSPVHTDKTHLYYAGEPITKQIAALWDGPGEAKISSAWKLLDAAGAAVAAGHAEATLRTGDIRFLPLTVSAPQVTTRTDYTLVLETAQDGKPAEGDRFPLTVFPAAAPVALTGKVALYDPAGKSAAWLERMGVKAAALRAGDKLDGITLLIVGREAMVPAEPLPYTADDLARGLKVLVLEQTPAVWRGLGLRSNEVMPRRVFASAPDCPLLPGLQEEDLVNWRGTPDLLPEGINPPAESRRAPKWTNTHALASSIPQTPRAVGFTPLLSAEFDLDYAPVLEWRHGQGRVIFCGLDFSAHAAQDPAAATLAGNLLRYLDHVAPEAPRQIACGNSGKAAALLKRLGASAQPVADLNALSPATTLLVIASEDGAKLLPQAEAFAAAGGQVFVLPQTADTLRPLGLRTAAQQLQRAPLEQDAAFRGIGANLLRWRDALSVEAFLPAGQPAGVRVLAGGIAAVKPVGKGGIFFCQVAPALLESKYAADKERAEAVDLSVIRLEQLLARLLGNFGAQGSLQNAARLTVCLDSVAQYQPLRNWSILGPYRVADDNGEQMLNTKFSAEEMARTGDTNPNITFPDGEGKILDWRVTLNPDKNGFVDLGGQYKVESKAVAYAVTTITSERDRDATLRVGCDWRMILWVNGKEVFRTLSGKNMPGAYYVRVKLKKGENALSCKIGSGSKGFGFYADITRETKPVAVANLAELKKVNFYANRAVEEEFDPYFFTYW